MGQHDMVSVGSRRSRSADNDQKTNWALWPSAERFLGQHDIMFQLWPGFVSFAHQFAVERNDDEHGVIVLEQCNVNYCSYL